MFKRRKRRGPPREPLFDFDLGACGWLVAALFFISGYVKREPAPFDLLLVMAIGFWAMTGAFVRGKRLMWVVFALAPYAATQFTGMIVSHDPLKSISVGAVTLYLIASVPALASIAGNPRWQVPKAMYTGLLISGVVFSAISILAYLNMFPMPWRWLLHKRAAGGFKDPNVFAAWLIPAFLYAVSSALDHRGRRSIAYAVCGGVMGMALLVAFSRGAWGQCALTLLVVYALQIVTPDQDGNKRKPRPGLWLFAGLLALLIAVYLSTNEAFVDLWSVRFGKQDYDQERFSAHDRGWELGISSMFGLGPGRVDSVVGMNVHNNYLHVLLEGGWLSLLGYTLFLISSIGRAIWLALVAPNGEDRLFFRVAAASLIGLAAESWIIDIYHWRHLWYMAAAAWFPIRVSEQALRAEKQYPPIYMPPKLRFIPQELKDALAKLKRLRLSPGDAADKQGPEETSAEAAKKSESKAEQTSDPQTPEASAAKESESKAEQTFDSEGPQSNVPEGERSKASDTAGAENEASYAAEDSGAESEASQAAEESGAENEASQSSEESGAENEASQSSDESVAEQDALQNAKPVAKESLSKTWKQAVVEAGESQGAKNKAVAKDLDSKDPSQKS